MIHLPYGKTFISLDTNSIKGNIQLIQPTVTPVVNNPLDHVMESIHVGLEQVDKNKLIAAKSIAIAINDKTRPVPYDFLLPPLLQSIRETTKNLKSIRLFIATGTHSPLNKDEIQQLIPNCVVDGCLIESHNCDDRSNLEFIGHTSRRTPVWINSRYLRSDIKIVTGNIEPHHFMGFSGGVKTAAIGLAGRETINRNHAMLGDPNAIMGKFSSNPMRMDVEEIGSMIGIDFALNTIIYNKQIVSSLFGSPDQVMIKGIRRIKEISEYRSNYYFDVVIASAGGHPKDINLYQAQKALTHSARLAKEGGQIILVAACPEGSGNQLFEEYIKKNATINNVIANFKRDGFSVGPHKALQIALIAEKHKITLISDLPPNNVTKFFMTPSNSLEDTLNMTLGNYKKNVEVAILPYATNIMAYVQQA